MRRTPLLFIALTSACGAAPLAAPGRSTPPSPSASPPAPSAPAMTLAQTGIQVDWMDPAADPCQDFFAYACGGFVKSAVIPPDRSSWSAAAQIDKENEELLRDVLEKAATDPHGDATLKKIGDYYAACTDEPAIETAGATPILPLLDVMLQVKDARSLAQAIVSLHANGVFPLFDVGSYQDFADATKMIVGIDQDGLGLPDRDYYLKDEGNTKEVRAFYEGHVARVLGLLGFTAADAKAAVADVMRIETKIAKLQQDKVTRRDPHAVYHRVDREGLPKLMPSFPWDAYFTALGIAGAKEVSVNEPSYYAGLEALMHEEKPEAWRHYLTWQIGHAEGHLLTKTFVEEDFALRRKLFGQKELAPRWKRCVRSADRALGELVAQPYVAARFAGDSKERARALVVSIHGAMRVELAGLPWMDETTRRAAEEKNAKITEKVGYPDKWRAYPFDVKRDAFAENALAARRYEQQRQLAKVGKPVDKGEWDMTPQTVNAYYNPSLNEIVLPAGELQPPFFSRSFYAVVNLGDEGANTIGHELTHGFDDEGSQFDGDGNLRDWWTKETKAKFDQATQCVKDQYSGYDAVPGVKLNGGLTAGENIADIGGVKLGYAALVAWKKAHPEEHRDVDGTNDEKLFFLAYAQGWCSKDTPELLEWMARANPHSPPRWRVNGPMADVPAWGEAFGCKVGSPMRPEKVCSVW